MKHGFVKGAMACALAIGASGCATTMTDTASRDSISDDKVGAMLAQVLAGESRVQGSDLDRRIAAASAHPLGSKENPVRAQGPAGQRAYLSRLRCSDTSRPAFGRIGSAGLSPYDNIVDIYEVTCSDGATPERSEIWMDMYHRGHVEMEPVPGYGIAGGRAPG